MTAWGPVVGETFWLAALEQPAELTPALRAILLVWLAVLGGAVGSFLNVVVYRMPRGRSILHPGSSCPACNRPIRWYDNVPVLSWFVLGGRCRDCRAAISGRYPLVEAAVAALFVLLARGPLFSAEASPGASAAWGMYVYQLLLFCLLVCVLLIDLDDQLVPLKLLAPLLAAGLAAPLVWPQIRPDGSLAGLPSGLDCVGPIGMLADGLLGAALGAVLAFCSRPSTAAGLAGAGSRRARLAALLAVGIYLGGGAAAVAAAATSLLFLAMQGAAVFTPVVGRIPWTMLLAAVTLGHAVGGGRATDSWSAIDRWGASPVVAWSLACGVVLAASLLTRRITRRHTGRPRATSRGR